jgi:beta-galactosidase
MVTKDFLPSDSQTFDSLIMALRHSPLHVLALTTLGSLLVPAAARETVSFDDGWRFARFGLMADGTRTPEPGTESPLIRITASSEEVGADRANTAVKAIDGDTSTRWCAQGPGGGQWLSLDLGKPMDIAKADITWEVESPAWQADIQGRESGGEWQPLPGKFRYLQVKVTAQAPGKWASIRELALTGKDGKPIRNSIVKHGGDPTTAGFDDSSWRKLDLPQDWGIEGPFRIDLAGATGKLPWAGIGWYRKSFKVPADASSSRFYLDFDGAMANAQVFCNGKFAGGWPYGYSSFRVDLTTHLKPGADNQIAVRLDTESWDSRWYPGAGIYRHVRLVKAAPVHVGQWGAFVTTPEISDEKAKIQVAIEVQNHGSTAAQAVVKTDIHEFQADGSVGAKVGTLNEATSQVASGQTASVSSHGLVEKPKL